MERKASLRVADFVDALPMPVDGNFVWKECRFEFFDYTKKSGQVVATTTAARVNFVPDVPEPGAQEFVQHYSVGDPERVVPSEDGRSLVIKGENQALNRSSNFFILMQHLESAGLPDGFMDDDFTVLEGMVTHNIGVPEPTRAGLPRAATPAEEGRRVRILAVPDDVIKMPGGKKASAGKAKKAEETEGENLLPEALAALTELVSTGKKVTRQSLATYAVKAKNTPLATFAYKVTPAQLATGGFEVDGAGVISVAGEGEE